MSTEKSDQPSLGPRSQRGQVMTIEGSLQAGQKKRANLDVTEFEFGVLHAFPDLLQRGYSQLARNPSRFDWRYTDMSEVPPIAIAGSARKSFGFPLIPASYFGMVLGLAGLASVWRAAHQAWGLSSTVGEVIGVCATVVWTLVTVLFTLKWVFARSEAVSEVLHPIQCCFVGLAGVATMLIAGFLAPYSRPVAILLFLLGAAFNFGFAVWRTGGLWQGGRDPETSTPVLYLPTVAGSFVTGTIAALLGWADWGQLAFGAGFFSWLAIESILVHRFLTSATMAHVLRPTLGIQMAPGPVGAVSLISVWPQAPAALAYAMIGYGLLQCAVLVRLAGWLRQQPFGPSYWAFTFGATALSTVPIRLVAQGDQGAMAVLAPALFLFSNVLVGGIAAGTVVLAFRGRLVEKFVRIPAPLSSAGNN